MTTGQRIKAARKKAKMTQRQLGGQLGLSFQSIAQWENDLRKPKYDTLKRIAAALGVEWTELVPEEQQEQTVVDHITEKLSNVGPPKRISTEEAYQLGILNLSFKSEEDRIAYFYSLLNTDGKLAASRCFYQHLDKNHIGEVADYVEKLSEIPQYQHPEIPQPPPAEPPADGIRMITVICPNCGRPHTIREDASTKLCRSCAQSLNSSQRPTEGPSEGG